MTDSQSAIHHAAVATIKKLSGSAWRDADITAVKIEQWLRCFKGEYVSEEDERLHAMHLLGQFIYYGKREVDECLRVLFDEYVAYPYVQKYKSNSPSPKEMEICFKKYLIDEIRFVGLGNPAESGTSFLYRFRQANRLSIKSFSTICDVVQINTLDHLELELEKQVVVDPPQLRHLIFLDDFSGSGSQATRRVKRILMPLRKAYPNLEISCFLLAATQSGLDLLNKSRLFDNVRPVIVFDDDYKAFCANSHYYRKCPHEIDKSVAEKIMRYYGEKLCGNSDAMGFGGCELLLGFQHNTPNNTLPTFWAEDPKIPWHPIFPRIDKIE